MRVPCWVWVRVCVCVFVAGQYSLCVTGRTADYLQPIPQLFSQISNQLSKVWFY